MFKYWTDVGFAVKALENVDLDLLCSVGSNLCGDLNDGHPNNTHSLVNNLNWECQSPTHSAMISEQQAKLHLPMHAPIV